MKAKNIILKQAFFLLFFAAIASNVTNAQDSTKQKTTQTSASIKSILDSKNYVFKAQSVIPLRGSTRQLTSDYDVRVFGDSVVTYLPYFGRAYSAPINTAEGGIQFTSTNFDYNVKERKKGGWDITIQPKEAKDVRELSFSVSERGYATLQVTSNNRDPISFNGYITARKSKK